MARQIRISDSARSDLDEIWLYIAADNLNAADSVIEACLNECRTLAVHPGIGHKRDDIPEDFRGWLVPEFPNYLVIYRHNDYILEVARILHGALNFPFQLGGDAGKFDT